MATRMNPPKKVRLACRRCRTRRIKCDGEVPACTNCAKAGETCLDVDSQNSGLLVPRNFASAARARIQWLEDIIKQRLPDVDVSLGPQIDAFPDPKGSAAAGGMGASTGAAGRGGDHDDDVSSSSPGSGRAGSQPAGRGLGLSGSQRGSLKRSAEAAGSYDHDEQFPDRAHSVAMNLGMLSLNSDSSQKHYLGSSSGVLFTNLIGASPSSAGSTPTALLEDVQAQGPSSEWHDTSVTSKVSQEYNRSLHVFLRQELPRKEDAVKLVHTYIRWIHPDYPVLEPSSLLSALDAIYSTFSCSLDDDTFPHGWPSTMQAFHWNGRQRLPGDQGIHSVPMPVVAFILFMVFNIAAVVKVRSRVYEFPPERFYKAAVHFSKDCFSQISLSSIQALVMLMVHSMVTPAEGRPLGFRDETFDIKMPDPRPLPRNPTSGTIPSSFSAAVLRFARCQFELDRIVSDVKLQLYHLPSDSNWFPLPQNPQTQQARIKEELDVWWERISSERFEYPGLDSRQRCMWHIKLKVKYHTTMVMLFQPSQAIRNPSPESLQVCFNNAAAILNGYQALHDMQGLHHGWRTVQNIFAAGATLIYSFWTCPTVRQNASTADLSRSLRTCSSLLTIGGEWWPSVKKGQRSFGAIVDLTVRKLYTGNMPSKNPRLSMGLSGDHRIEDGQTALDDADGAYGATAQQQQANLSHHIHINGADVSSWHQMTGSSAAAAAIVSMAHSQDPSAVHWQGVYPDSTAFHTGTNDYVPEIETFLADFDKSEFSWSFPLAGVGDPFTQHNTLDYGLRLQALRNVQKSNNRPLTVSEKVLYSHLIPGEDVWLLDDIHRGKTILRLRPDRVACHDATATMALLQFISAGLPRVRVPTSVHSDHLIVAEKGDKEDLTRAASDHREVYAFLSSAARKYGIGYWKPGAGIIHTTIFENYAFPGGLMIGTDSHTPNAGGMGMLGIGVGGADAVDAMSGMPWELACPKVVGVRLAGKLQGWSSSKDIICKLAGILTVSGGKGKIIEFFGPGTETLGATAMATVCNMSAEIGSTSCIFPYSEAMSRYLSATKRADIAKYADSYKEVLLTADEGSDRYYDDVIEIDLSTLEPHINGPFTPDLAHPLSQFKDHVNDSSWPVNLSCSLVGSCTNSSYEDLEKVRDLVTQAREAGLTRTKTPFLVSPGSEQIRATAEDAGILDTLRQAGATVLSNSCGPCVGQWDRKDVDIKGAEKNSVISSFNRNFTGRHDSNPATHSFVTSPELATAFAFAGNLTFNPVTDSIPVPGGSTPFRFSPPKADELPIAFSPGADRFQPPVLSDTSHFEVNIDPKSDRLQLLTPFNPWKPGNAIDMTVLIKVRGKCTTDHISPAGPWYNYRGHLENISNNLLLGATNGFLPDASSLKMIGKARDPIDGGRIKPVPEAARSLKQAGVRWCIIGDANYGEGSSREHAALEPRFLGGVAVIARSFARIHETNLKKQGMLPLTFADPADYNRIADGDHVSLLDVEDGELRPGRQVTMEVTPRESARWRAILNHSYELNQIEWLRAGSALNHIKRVALAQES
ncbi:aconitate hydratase [Colletotrichum musicola]|uniref:Aconitate hydratase, mitochondrial n=1 Tax=Colletotrichum musicola TaxID=2175873 RepID=A0A8H6JQ34_9PEZI|nr:aconitate hydratase [Colletotrichum musicola]